MRLNIPNPELELAGDFVRDTGCHIFLTGKAGTGKTTFLHDIKKSSPKRLMVTAPTGVAAINAGGVTLHSFFQLPFGPFVPGEANTRSRYRFSREKKNIIKSLDLLIIDEISMVRADVLDGVDTVLRRHRRSNAPFGGVQLLMIGDLFQLPPVVKKEEWQLLAPYYTSPYFFSCHALRNTEMITLELKHIYRQADSRFIDLLNKVRNNRLDESALKGLNARYIPNFTPLESEGYITLCTHNRIVDVINESRLSRLPAKSRFFEAEIEGEFPGHLYPTAAALELKPGAQVMFMRNDASPEKRYFNGKIGTVTRMANEEVHIKCPDDSEAIEVAPTTWENIEYALDRETGEITEKMIGVFRQYPLRLAWAITIHKSQGLTFDKAIIDANAAFAHGQVYVALSRCRSLEGMVLARPLTPKAVQTDTAVRQFSLESGQNNPSESSLVKSKIRYQQELLLECFDFQRLCGLLRRVVSLLRINAPVIRVFGVEDMAALQQLTETEIRRVSENFLRQLNGLFSESELPATDPKVLERISRASTYFQEKISAGIGGQTASLQIETDNKILRKKVKDAVQNLREEVAVKLAAVKSCADDFSPTTYFRAVSAAEIDTGGGKKKTGKVTYSEADITHPELFQILKDWRNQKAKDETISHYQVLHQKTLIQICVNLPDKLPDLKKMWGIGKRLSARYGEELVEMVRAYRKRHNITEVAPPEPIAVKEPPKKPNAPGIDTKKASLELFEKGLTMAEIAGKRELVPSTIEGHMAHWVGKGAVTVARLLSPGKQRIISEKVSQMEGENLGEIKKALGDDISYGEIKIVLAHLKRLAASGGGQPGPETNDT